MNVPVIELSGTPYEIGYAHGSLCKKQVLASLDYYTKAYGIKDVSWALGKRLARTYDEQIRKFDPDLVQEMQGIADGAGLTYEDILSINCRSEVTRMDVSQKVAALREMSEGCTAFAVMPTHTADGKTYHAQTWDFAAMQRDALVILKLRQSGKPDILMFTEGGLVGGKGMNAAGVSLTLNALRTSGDPSGVPLHIVMRGMLESPSITAAYHRAASCRCAAAACIMLAADRCAMAIELVPGDLDVFYPIEGYVAHTNHVLSTRFPNIVDYGKRVSSSSYLRYGRCCSLLHGRRGITLEDVKAILSDHVGAPGSICIHPDTSLPRHLQDATNYGIIFDVGEKAVHFCPGNPCEGEYVTFRL